MYKDFFRALYIARRLFDARTDPKFPNHADNQGKTGLLFTWRHVEVMKQLHDGGSEANVVDFEGIIPLHIVKYPSAT